MDVWIPEDYYLIRNEHVRGSVELVQMTKTTSRNSMSGRPTDNT